MTGRIVLAGALLLLGARCASPPRPLQPAEIAELAQALKDCPFPIRRADFWRRCPFRQDTFKPGLRALTTGILWEEWQLADDRFLVLRTLADDRPHVDDWYDGATVAERPGRPWTP